MTDFSIDDDRDVLVVAGVEDLSDLNVTEILVDGVYSTVLEANGNSVTLVGVSFAQGAFGEVFDSASELNEYSGTYDYDAIQLA